MNRELFWIWLSLGAYPGSRSCKRILERFRTPEEFFRAPTTNGAPSGCLSRGAFSAEYP